MKLQGQSAAGRRFRAGWLVVGLGSLAIFGCGGETPQVADQPDPAAVVARYAGGEIRRGDIQQAIDNNLASAAKPVSAEARRAIVRKVVERRVRTQMLMAEAVAKGYPQQPAVLSRQTAAEERVLAEDLLASETAAVKAADAVVVAELDRRLAAARSEETRKFSHIYLRAAQTDAPARQAAAATMAKIQQQLAGGASFNSLAEQYSTSVMARGGGRIDWTPKRQLHPAAAAAVFALAKEGELSPVVETADGLHLFRLDGIRLAAPIDTVAIRNEVRQELDSEAKNAALRARRQQELDAFGAEFAATSRLAALEAAGAEAGSGAAGQEWVARWRGAGGAAGEMTVAELLALEGRVLPVRQPLEVELRWLVENRLLAAARRARGSSPALDQQIADARRLAIIDSYRTDLMEALDTPPSEEEIARFYRDNGASFLPLRDFEIDALYFPQQGDSVAEVYAAGEEVGNQLRQGTPFDQLLARPSRPEAQVCREVHGANPEEIGKGSLRLRKALVNLGEGEVSAAIYIDRALTVVPAGCAFKGPGIVFVRLRRVGTLPLEAGKPAILRQLSKERVDQGVAQIQDRLIAESKLEILLPEG